MSWRETLNKLLFGNNNSITQGNMKKVIRTAKAIYSKRQRRIANKAKLTIGWKEWCSLPTLRIPAIKAKIDTGAKTSSLHAYDIKPFQHNGEDWVSFHLHPIQKNNDFSIRRSAPIIDQRYVTSSSGHKELRYVIATTIKLGKKRWEIELTLANREKMMFRMLLGRDALKGFAIIDPISTHRQKKLTSKIAKKLFEEHKI